MEAMRGTREKKGKGGINVILFLIKMYEHKNNHNLLFLKRFRELFLASFSSSRLSFVGGRFKI